MIRKFACIAALAFAMLASAQAWELWKTDAGNDSIVRENLHVARASGLTLKGDAIRFSGNFKQVDNEPVVMEAELAMYLAGKEGNVVGVDPTASGGGYATNFLYSCWQVTLKTPGSYTLWTRSSFPVKGSWSHNQVIDGQGETLKDFEGATAPGQWQWVKGRAYDLKAGAHSVGMNYQGGTTRLDLMVLSPDGDKEPDLATLKSSYSGPSSGEVWTIPVKPMDVAKWDSVHFDLQPNGGTAVCEISTDLGSTWNPVPENGDLSKLPVLGKGKDSVMFHVKLQGADPTRPPMFGGAWLSYKPGPENIKVVENSRLRMEIDSTGVKSIFDKKSKQYVVNARKEHGSLLTLSCKKPGPVDALEICDLSTAVVDDIQISSPAEDTKLMTLKNTLANGMKSTATALLKPDGQIEWNLSVDNPTKLEIYEVKFPLLSGCRIGEDGSDDWFFIPKCWGQVIQNPETLAPGGFAGPAMRWTMIWDKSAGLYLAIENYKLDDYAFSYGSTQGMKDLAIAPIVRILGKPGETWNSETYRLAVTGPDWHEGADIYRATVGKSLKKCDVAPHVKWLLDAWNYQLADNFPSCGWDTIRLSFESQEAFGTSMFANRQMLEGSSACWNGYYPYPAPAWGSTAEFAQQLEALRNKGGFYMPYLNYRLFTGRYCSMPRLFTYAKARLPQDIPKPDAAWYAKAASRRLNGSTGFSDKFFDDDPMSVKSREWRDWLSYWTSQYLNYGTDGMYYDQFNMIYPDISLREDYPNSYGAWVIALMDSFRKIKDESKKENPYCVFIGEGCNDIYGQLLDVHMTSGVFNRIEFDRYAVPDQLLLDGSWNGAFAQTGSWERERFIWQVGSRFQEMAGNIPNDRERKWVTSILKLRRAVKSILYDATFKDNAGLTIKDSSGKEIVTGYTDSGKDWSAMKDWAVEWPGSPVNGVSARWFLFKKDEQSGAVVNCINAIPAGDVKNPSFTQRSDVSITLSTKEIGKISSAWAWLLDGSIVPVNGKQNGDTYTFKMPESEMSSVVLSNKLRPVVAWNFDNVTARGATRQFNLNITNVNASPLKGTVVMELPKGWIAAAPIAFGPLEPGKSVELSVPVTVPKDAALGRHDVWCRVKTDSGDFAAYHFAVVNQPVLVEFRGNIGTYQLWFRNLTDASATASVKLSAPEPLKVECSGQIEIPAMGTVTMPVTVSGQLQLREISEMAAEVSIGQMSKRLVRAVMPAIPNGDFEMDSAKDMKPDWWMCRTDGNHATYEKMNLSADDAHGGKYSLRLDPPTEDQKYIYAFPEYFGMKTGAKYKISFWVRCKAKEGVYASLNENSKIGEGKTSEQWQEMSAEIIFYGGMTLKLINSSKEPAFFDDFKIEEL